MVIQSIRLIAVVPRAGVLPKLLRAHGYRGEMRSFPREDAVALYKRIYWIRPGFGQIGAIAPDIAAELFDTGVNMGPGVAVSFLQRALNALNCGAADCADIAPGVRIDDATVAALATFLAKRAPNGTHILMKALKALQGERYPDLPERRPANEAFLYGWLANRLG